MTDEPLVLDGAALSVEHTYTDYGLSLRWWVVDGGDTRTVATLKIPAQEILDFLQDVNQHGLMVIQRAAQAYEYGNCTTCDNLRLVEVEERGRAVQIGCPDCRGDGVAVAFANVPRAFRSGREKT